MNTISLDSIGRQKLTTGSFNQPIALSDGRLVTMEYPSFSGVFEAPGGDLPSIQARGFRLNASGGAVNVSQKQIFFSKHFDTDLEGIGIDSPSLALSLEQDVTPLGQSQILKLDHSAATAAYHTIPNDVGTDGLFFRIYFKVDSLDADLQPIGLYTVFDSIDINFPAAAIRIKPNLDIIVRRGYDDLTVAGSGKITLGAWNRATIVVNGSDFTATVEQAIGGGYNNLFTSPQYTSSGAGLLSELSGLTEYVVGISSEGNASHYVDTLEGYLTTGQSEVISPGQSYQYYCARSLDEFNVTGACTGYFWR